MENETILRTLFNVCEAEQLPVMRQVCKKWYNESLYAFRDASPVQIGWKRIHVDKDYKSFPLLNFEDVGEMFKLTLAPFRRIKISDSSFDPTEMEEDQSGRMVHSHGDDMIILDRIHNHMRLEVVISLAFNRVAITISILNDILFTRMPNLEELKLEETDLLNDGEMIGIIEHAPVQHQNIKSFGIRMMKKIGLNGRLVGALPFLQRFLTALPQLRSLQFGFNIRQPVEISTLMALLMEHLEKQNNIPKQLTSLDLLRLGNIPLIHLPDQLIDTWKGKFQLTVLKVYLGTLTAFSPIIILLSSFSTTLRQLHLFRGSTSLDDSCKDLFANNVKGQKALLPRLDKLIVDEIYDFSLSSLALIDAPDLKHLILRDPDITLIMDVFYGPYNRIHLLGGMSFKLLKQLDLKRFSPYTEFTRDEFQLLRVAAPNIKKLSLPIGRTGFPIICEIWPNLELLHIYGPHRSRHPFTLMEALNDEAVTGIPDRSLLENLKFEPEINPNITCLKLLRSFTLEVQYISGGVDGMISYLTDHAVFEGFLKVPKLSRLSIPLNKISENGMAALKQNNMLLNDQGIVE